MAKSSIQHYSKLINFIKYSKKLNSSNPDKSYPENCILAIKPKGMSILDLERVIIIK